MGSTRPCSLGGRKGNKAGTQVGGSARGLCWGGGVLGEEAACVCGRYSELVTLWASYCLITVTETTVCTHFCLISPKSLVWFFFFSSLLALELDYWEGSILDTPMWNPHRGHWMGMWGEEMNFSVRSAKDLKLDGLGGWLIPSAESFLSRSLPAPLPTIPLLCFGLNVLGAEGAEYPNSADLQL